MFNLIVYSRFYPVCVESTREECN